MTGAGWHHTEHLVLRTWRAEDREIAIALWTDPSVSRFIIAGGRFTEGDALNRLAREIETERKHGYQYWPLFLRTTGEPVGCCGLKQYRFEERVLEFGVQLLPAFWGRGLANEAGRAVSTEETVLQALRVLVEAEQSAALVRQHAPRPRR